MSEFTKNMYLPVVDEQGNQIINNNNILLCNKTTHEIIYVPITEDVLSEFQLGSYEMDNKEPDPDPEPEPVLDSEPEPTETKIWSHENTLFLIDTYKKFETSFACGVKKNVWEKVAAARKHLNKNISGKQCETKWKTLKRTYINIKNHNNTSGQDKRYWEFYDLIDSILFKKPEIQARATCSNISQLRIQGEKKIEVCFKNNEEASSSSEASSSGSKEIEENAQFESSFSKNRKERVSDVERRHKEKMQRLDKFNDIFAKMVEKMPD